MLMPVHSIHLMSAMTAFEYDRWKYGWHLSPAYDMNPVVNQSELSLNITDTDNRRTIENVLSVPVLFRLSDAEAFDILENMRNIIHQNWRKITAGYGIREQEIHEMESAFALCDL